MGTAMATFRRDHTQGGTYFFTLVSYRRQEILTHPEVIAAMRKAVKQVNQQYPFTVIAWVVLPDHMHAIWTLPQGDAEYALRWGLIKRFVARSVRSAHEPCSVRTAHEPCSVRTAHEPCSVRSAHEPCSVRTAHEPCSVRSAHEPTCALPLTLSQQSRHESGLWQRRFWEHRIRDDEDLQRHVDYIHYNPVKHGWVERVENWPHSTFHRYVRHGLLSPDWASSPGGLGTYGE